MLTLGLLKKTMIKIMIKLIIELMIMNMVLLLIMNRIMVLIMNLIMIFFIMKWKSLFTGYPRWKKKRNFLCSPRALFLTPEAYFQLPRPSFNP